MKLFNKKEEIPEIPEAPSLPDLNLNFKPTTPNLPLPSGGDSRDLSNREIIRSAIEDSSEKIGDDEAQMGLPEIPVEKKAVLRESKIQIPEAAPIVQKRVEIPTIQEPPMSSVQKEAVQDKKDSSIFVKIDKIHSAQRDFEEMQGCIERISGLIKNLNYTKKEEDEEMRGLSEDVEKIKEKITDIDSKIFNKI